MRAHRMGLLFVTASVLLSASGSGALAAQSTGRLRLPVIDAVVDSGLEQASLMVKLVSDNPGDTTVAPAYVMWQAGRAGRWWNAQGTALTELTMPLGHVKDISNPALKYELSYAITWRLGRTAAGPTFRELKATVYAAVRDGASVAVGAPFPGASKLLVVRLPQVDSALAENTAVIVFDVSLSCEQCTINARRSAPRVRFDVLTQGWIPETPRQAEAANPIDAIHIRVDSTDVARGKNVRLRLQYLVQTTGNSSLNQTNEFIPLPPGKTAVVQVPPVPAPK